MTSVVRNRHRVRPSFFWILGLALLVLAGCTSSTQEKDKSGSEKKGKATAGKQAKSGGKKDATDKSKLKIKPGIGNVALDEEPDEENGKEPGEEAGPGKGKQAPAGTSTPRKSAIDEVEVDDPDMDAPEKAPVKKKVTKAEPEKPAAKAPATEKPAAKGPAQGKPAATAPSQEKSAGTTSTSGIPAEGPAAKEKKPGPTELPTTAWLPKPVVNVPEAEAKDESEMKSYTEPIPETDAKFGMVPIKGGKFLMGSSEEEFRRFNKKDESDKDAKEKVYDEGPQHEVVIEPFWMGKCEVTWDEYELWGMKLDMYRRRQKREQQKTPPTEREQLVDAVAVPTNPYSDMTFGMGKEGYPAICMTQLAAKLYCKWLSAKTGRYYRLPTEAEWEYACRAGTTTPYSCGDDPEKLGDYAWHFDNADDKYHKVGQKKPNPWGLYDMHGNVSEWVVDQYVVDGYKQFAGKSTKNPLIPATTEYSRVVRGGSWAEDPPALRSAARRASTKLWKMQDPQIPQSIWYLTDAKFVGFRVVRPLRTPSPDEAKRYDLDEEQLTELEEYRKAQHGKM